MPVRLEIPSVAVIIRDESESSFVVAKNLKHDTADVYELLSTGGVRINRSGPKPETNRERVRAVGNKRPRHKPPTRDRNRK
jgi:hypothetical protein